MRTKILREIQTLHHLANYALVQSSITEVLQTTAESIASFLPADRVSVIGFNTEKESVDYFVEAGEGRGNIVTTVSYDELRDGLSGWALRNGTPALSSKSKPDPRESDAVRARRLATNCGSILVVPVQNHERYLATITVINRPDQRDFALGDIEILTVFSTSVAVLIENAKLLADVQLSRDLVEVSRVQLAEQNVMKDKLFTILAHDLRGPVGSLSVLLGVAADLSLDPDDLRDVLLEGHRSSTQTYNLLDNLLGWVRSQMEEVKVLRTRFLAVKSLIAVQSWMEAQAKAKGITLKLECSDEMTVDADERMFETILRNFVSNAVKYSRQNAAITIRAVAREDSVAVEVQDEGEGVSPEKLAELFGSRNVESEIGTNGEKGNGLGLMFCADLARALGGRLEAESVVSVGSTFRLVLPDLVEGEL